MGKGDKKTKRGKIIIGSFGVRRPSKKTKPVVSIKVAAEKKIEKVVSEKVKVEKKIEKVENVVPETVASEKKTTKKPAAKKPKKETKESAE